VSRVRVRRLLLWLIAAFVGFVAAAAAFAGAVPSFVPYHADGIYALGEKAGWTVSLPAGAVGEPLTYTVKVDEKVVLTGGTLVLAGGSAKLEVAYDKPAMLYVAVTDGAGVRVATLGAAVAPTQIQPTAPCPPDFDEFWAGKLKTLREVPVEPELTPLPSPNPNVELYAVKLRSLNSHVQGYLAKPKGEGKFPALIIYQYAGVYALQTQTVVDRAAKGWLAFDVNAHDMPPDQASGAPTNYQTVGNTDRETSYFLEMYLRDTRALDYFTARPDWDGKTLVAFGASMGGMQTLATAGLNPNRFTALVVNQPAGADADGELAGRHAGYPNWKSDDPAVMKTGLYFDTVNFARHITAPVLMSMGFIDTTVTPSGVWTVFNQIKTPKEAFPLIDADHMHITPDKMGPFNRKIEDVLETLRKGEPFLPNGTPERTP
jgi:cephalosporin-C deacetylase